MDLWAENLACQDSQRKWGEREKEAEKRRQEAYLPNIGSDCRNCPDYWTYNYVSRSGNFGYRTVLCKKNQMNLAESNNPNWVVPAIPTPSYCPRLTSGESGVDVDGKRRPPICVDCDPNWIPEPIITLPMDDDSFLARLDHYAAK